MKKNFLKIHNVKFISLGGGDNDMGDIDLDIDSDIWETNVTTA